jgi:hypothetical protein
MSLSSLDGFYEPLGTTVEPVGTKVLVDSYVTAGHSVRVYSYVPQEIGPGLREVGLLVEVGFAEPPPPGLLRRRRC